MLKMFRKINELVSGIGVIRIAGYACLICSTCFTTVAAAPDAPGKPSMLKATTPARNISYTIDRASAEPVLSYRLVNHMIADTDHASVEVYADGKVVVSNPAYMKNPGKLTTRLSESELEGLISKAIDNGLADFAADSVSKSLRDARTALRNKGKFHAISDVATTDFRINLKQMTPVGKAPIPSFSRNVSIDNLEYYSKTYQDIDELSRLKIISDRFEALRSRKDLVRQ